MKDPEEAAREIARPDEETVREISETIDPMENTQYTKMTENVHFRRAPFQSTVTGDRSAAEEAMGNEWIRQLTTPTSRKPEIGDDWIRQRLELAALTSKEPEKVTVPATKPFSGKLPDQELGVDREGYIETTPISNNPNDKYRCYGTRKD